MKRRRQQPRPPQDSLRPFQSSSPNTPSYLDKGLASETNRRHVVAVLGHSTHEEIEAVLRQVGYRARGHNEQPVSSAERRDALERAVTAYLRTTEGEREYSILKQKRIQSAVDRWLETEQARAELARAKAAALTGEALKEGDLTGLACRKAVEEHVARWLKSPLGRETLEQEKQRVVRRGINVPPPPTIPSWVARQLNPGDSHGEG